jgi:hypothetical protein
MSACMCVFLLPEQMNVFFLSHLVSKSLFITGQCPVNMNILTPKTEALQMNKKIYYFEKGSNSFD